jgi:hypothetical protein
VIGCREGNSITFDRFRRIGVFTTVIQVMGEGNVIRSPPKRGWKIGRSRLFQNANLVVRENRSRLFQNANLVVRENRLATDIVEGSAMILGLQSRSIRTDESLVLAVLLALWRAV